MGDKRRLSGMRLSAGILRNQKIRGKKREKERSGGRKNQASRFNIWGGKER